MAKLNEIFIKSFSGEWGAEDLDGTGTPVLRTTNFTNHGVINYTDVVTRNIKKKNISDKYLSKGDIIIEKSGGSDKQPVGRVVFFDGEEGKYLFNNFTGLLRVKNKDEWLPRYVFYALFANYCVGGTRRYENRTTGLHNLQLDAYLSGTEIKKRNYEIQIEIVNNLDKVSELIGRFKEQLQDFDLLIKSRFIEMFGDKDYPHKKLAEVACICSSKRIYANEYVSEGVPFYRSKEIRELGDGKRPSVELFISSEKYNFLKARFGVPQKGDILIAAIGATIGYMWVINTDNPFYYKDGNLILISDFRELNSMYLEFVLKKLISKFKEQGAAGSAQLALTIEKVEKMEVAVPPIELQNQFADFVEQVNKSKFTHCYELLLLIIKKIWYNNYV